jgi:hypothetical protein
MKNQHKIAIYFWGLYMGDFTENKSYRAMPKFGRCAILTYNIQIWMKCLQYRSFPVTLKAFNYHLEDARTAH